MPALLKLRRLPIILVEPKGNVPPPRKYQWRALLASAGAHLAVILIMACVVLEFPNHFAEELISVRFSDGNENDVPLNGLEDSPALSMELDSGAIWLIRNPAAEAGDSGETQLSLPQLAWASPGAAVLTAESAADVAARVETMEGGPPEEPSSRRGGTGITDGRTGANKAALLKKFGGTPQTENAVDLGLKWLTKQQRKDGSWSFAGPYADGASFGENRTAATAMALLAILGAGHTHQSGDYQRPVNRALNWLVDRQRSSNGSFTVGTPQHHAYYTHAQATIAICEAYAMTEDEWLKPHCVSALAYAVKSQGPLGGWRYEYRGDSDTSVTGWFVMALVSGRSAGFDVPDKTLAKINDFFDQVSQDYGQLYSYAPGRPTTPSMTAEGLLCRMYLGWPRETAAIDGGVERLLQVAPFRLQTQGYYYWYYATQVMHHAWYYATQVMHHAGGTAWEQWNDVMREQLPLGQITAGPEKGSWPPGGRMLDQTGGRLYATCMSLYCLEVYYRHLPIYESPWDDEPEIERPARGTTE